MFYKLVVSPVNTPTSSGSFPACCCSSQRSDSSFGGADGPGVRWSANKPRDAADFTAKDVGLFTGETTAHRLLHQL